MSRAGHGIETFARSLPVRLLLPAVFLVLHLVALTALARVRFGRPFNSSPHSPPAFTHPATELVPPNWRRLVVSRWDAQHYIELALRGYQPCAPRAELGPTKHPDDNLACQLNFFPGYAYMGRAVAAVARMPIDYALLGVSLLASYLAMFLWTSRAMVESLGFATTYLSLVLLNVFTTGYALVTVQTEPTALLATVGAFVLLHHRKYALGALCAGATGVIRPTGVATGMAFALALLVATIQERPRLRVWVWRLFLGLVAGWGILALFAFWQIRFGDPLIYSHARTRYYHYVPNPLALLVPKYSWLSESIWAAPNEGLWLAAGLFIFALGHRSALARVPLPGRVYWYALFVFVVGVAAAGQVEIAFAGLSRYLLLALPMFFAAAAALRRHPIALGLWIAFSAIHYWSVNACFYVGHGEPGFANVCHFAPGT